MSNYNVASLSAVVQAAQDVYNNGLALSHTQLQLIEDSIEDVTLIDRSRRETALILVAHGMEYEDAMTTAELLEDL